MDATPNDLPHERDSIVSQPHGSDATARARLAFGSRLSDELVNHKEFLWSMAPEGSFKRLKKQTAHRDLMHHLSGVSRQKLGWYFSGKALPPPADLDDLLRPLGNHVDIAAWRRWRTAAAAAVPDGWSTFDPRSSGLFVRDDWNGARRLERERLLTTIVPRALRPTQLWIDHDVLADAIADARGSGELLYLLDVDPDHRESAETEFCRVTLAPTDYKESVAVSNLRKTAGATLERADLAVANQLGTYLTSAVPSALCVNVVVMSGDDEVLFVRRSGAVDSATGQWTVGLIESMKHKVDGDFFELAYRALRHEMAIEPSEVLNLQLTWLGICRPVLRGHVVAVARVDVPADEWPSRREQAWEGYENDMVSSAVLDLELLEDFFACPIRLESHESHPIFDFDFREWVDHARLAMREADRFRRAHPSSSIAE